MSTNATIQTLTFGGVEYAVVPRDEYDALRDIADEDAVDIAIARRVLEDPDQELVPFELVKRMANGERVWREYRGMPAIWPPPRVSPPRTCQISRTARNRAPSRR